MAQPAKSYSTFVQGIITEASPLTFPENASIDERNFVLKRDGSRERRLGMDFEEGFVQGANIANATFQDLAVATSEWRGVDNNSTVNFAVVQVGTTIYFYDLAQATVSANIKSFTVDLTVHQTAFATQIGSAQIQTSVGKGVLFVASPEIDPFYVEYSNVGGTELIVATSLAIEVRDFVGVVDGFNVDERPATYADAAESAKHTYNLLNQGWSQTNIDAYKAAADLVYPSNADVWVLGKNTSDVFTPSILNLNSFGNTPAPKGHFIINAFNRVRTGVTTETDEGRPSSIGFYAGRVWYAGIESIPSAGDATSGNVYFSQSLTSLDKAGYCHQEADPTSENISELVDTDGGVITIPEAGNIIKLLALRDSIVVFADNGVWQISGGGIAFTGTNYQVDKITASGATNVGSIVAVESVAVYWSSAGIHILEAQTATHILGARSMTEESIQTLYNEIPSVSRLHVQGNYDPASKRIAWLYNDSSGYDGVLYRHKYNKELIFDGVLKAYYLYEISNLASNTPYIAGVVSSPSLLVGDTAYQVQVNGDDVEYGGGTGDVQVTLATPIRGALSTKYLCVEPQDSTNSKVTWGEYSNTSFLEWEAADGTGITYLSYLLTGYELFGDMSRNKYVPYITCHFGRTETGFVANAGGGFDAVGASSCLLQARWEWSNSVASGRWGDAQQVYRLQRLYIPTGASDTYDDGFSVCTTKSKLRGKGQAVSLYFYSEEGKDMHILGWAMAATGVKEV